VLNITSGRIARPQKLVFYGSEGIGKTSLAAQCPDPLFIDTEGGTAHLDVRRTQKPQDWDELIELVKEIAITPDICRTLVIDTADWAESMCIDFICKKYNQPGIESFGYGKGYSYLAEEFSRLLLACNEVILSGKNVVITAHAKMRKQELPDEQGAFDRWELKLSKQTAPLLKEWPDALLFLNFKTFVIATDANTHKAQGGKRVIYTSHHPCWDAKNRHNLPEELDLAYASIAPVFEAVPSAPIALPKQTTVVETVDKIPAPATQETATSETMQTLKEWMEQAKISPEMIQTLVAQKGHFPADKPIAEYPERFVRGWLMHNWAQVVTTIQNNPEYTPF
jgi:GTPase SAR1 family protein